MKLRVSLFMKHALEEAVADQLEAADVDYDAEMLLHRERQAQRDLAIWMEDGYVTLEFDTETQSAVVLSKRRTPGVPA